MGRTPKISGAEWEVMKVLWGRPPMLAQEIIEKLSARKWQPKTVKTLINRLLGKGALGYEKDGRAYRYRALVEEDECVMEESRSLLDRLFGGSLPSLVAHFAERQSLAPEDLKELEAILKRTAGKSREG